MAAHRFVTPSVEDLTLCYVKGRYFDGKTVGFVPTRAANRASFMTPSVEHLTQCYVNGQYFDGKRTPTALVAAQQFQGAAPTGDRKRSNVAYSDGVRRVKLPVLQRSGASSPTSSGPGSPRADEHEVSFHLDLASPVASDDLDRYSSASSLLQQ